MILRPFYKVGNDQEIARETHVDDHVEFEVEPVEIAFSLGLVDNVQHRQAPFEPCRGIAAQLLDFPGQIASETGQDRISFGRGECASLRHDQSVFQRFRDIGKQFFHHQRAFHPKMFGWLLALVIFDIGRLRDALHCIMRLVKTGFGKTARVGRHQRDIAVHRKPDEARLRGHLDWIVTTRQFDIKPPVKIVLQQCQIGLCF